VPGEAAGLAAGEASADGVAAGEALAVGVAADIGAFALFWQPITAKNMGINARNRYLRIAASLIRIIASKYFNATA
jgi:hypothetical protein